VSLKRMATEEIADKCKMLELFTSLENFVESVPDAPSSSQKQGQGGEEEDMEDVGSREHALSIVGEAIELVKIFLFFLIAGEEIELVKREREREREREKRHERDRRETETETETETGTESI